MPVSVPVPDKSSGDIFTEALWDSYIRDNINKLLDRGHRTLTVSQFAALTGLEDGDEAYLEVDAANGILWHLVYEATEATYKWRFLGGPPLAAEITAAEATTTNTYVALTTAGPTITLPRAGEYKVGSLAWIEATNNGATGVTAWASYDIGATGAADADAARVLSGGASDAVGKTVGASAARKRVKTIAAASTALTMKYRTQSAITATFADRRISATPVRLI